MLYIFWLLRNYYYFGTYSISQLSAVDDSHMIGQLGDVFAIQLTEILQKKYYLIIITGLERKRVALSLKKLLKAKSSCGKLLQSNSAQHCHLLLSGAS